MAPLQWDPGGQDGAANVAETRSFLAELSALAQRTEACAAGPGRRSEALDQHVDGLGDGDRRAVAVAVRVRGDERPWPQSA